MRRFLWGLWKVGLALTLSVVIALCVVWNPNPNAMRDGSRNPPQWNLQTALTGAATFYAINHHSYVGVDGGPDLPAGAPSIGKIAIGLTYVSGRSDSTGPNVVSIYAPSRSGVVMTAYSKGLRTCWGVLTSTHSRARPYFPSYPSTADKGTFYFRGASSASLNCAASRVVAAALSTSGFPAA